MSAGDVELLRELYSEWERGDFSREFFADEIVSQNRGLVDMDAGQQGLDEVIAVQREWLQQWERPFRVEAEEYLEAGDRVVVLIRWFGRGKGSGAEVESKGAHVWEIRDGKAVRFDVYRDRGEALAYAGLADDATKVDE